MEFNAVTAGVNPGGLVSTTEIKILICYILKNVKDPVPETRLCELLFYEGIANVFEVSDALTSLYESGHIKLVDPEENSYTVNESGINIAETLKTSVPITIREKACLATVKMISKIRNAKETDIHIGREGDNTYITCSAIDGKNTIISIKLLVSDEAQAISIKNRFIDDPSGLYTKIIDLLTD